MGFSRSQQGLFRPMVAKAWEIHCTKNGLLQKDKTAKELWYRAELLQAINRDSTSHANTGRDFDACMAHFESVCGDSIHWNTEVFNGDSKRIIYAIGQICEKHTISQAYVLGTARNILKNRELNNLHQIEDAEDLEKVKVALLIHARRKAKEARFSKAGQEVKEEAEEDGGNPF